MTSSNTALPEQRRHWGRFRPSAMAVVALVVVLGIAVLIGWHWRFHLLWKYEESRLGLHDIQAIADSPMPDSPTPNDWLRCRVGPIEFSLPPELASNRVVKKDDASIVSFQHDSRIVVIDFSDASELSGLLKTASDLCPQPQRFTLPRLRRACYQASSADFRWSMSAEEARWHGFCMTAGKLIRVESDGNTESFFRQDLDGIVHFGGERAVFDWQSNDSRWMGDIHFIDRGEKIDTTWIRTVCQSLTVPNEAQSEHQDVEEGDK